MATAVAPGVLAAGLEEFRAQLRGDVITGSGGEGAGRVRAVFNAMHVGTPAVTVRPTGTADVVDAVQFAREQDLKIGVRGGGHSIAGLSALDGGLLLDLSAMDGVVVDPGRKLVTAQGGALLGDIDRETQAFGLATPLGVVSETGVAGLTLGGGYGWLRRKYGLSCDNLVEAQVVCADGEVRTASEQVNPDLFWAIRGGGGNFGVVTSFTFRLYPVGPEVAFAAVMYPEEEMGDILRQWRGYMAKAPDEVTSIVVALTFPADPHLPPEIHDRRVAIAAGVYSGETEEGMRVMQPLREFGTPVFDMSGPTPYHQVQTGFDWLFPRGGVRSYWKSQYVDELSDGVIDVVAATAQGRPAPTTVVATFAMGGALAAVDPEATAFSERTPNFMISIDGNWSDPAQDDDMIAWVRARWQEVLPFGTGAVYLNFTGLADEAPSAGVDTAFGRNLQRLAKIKAKYDPDNFFRVNNNIVPAA